METKRGRPFTPDEKRADALVQFRLTDAEKAAWREAAKRAGMNMSAWIKDRLEKAAKRECRSGQASKTTDND